MFIDYTISFRTRAPALGCEEKIMLLPVIVDEVDRTVSWKVWVLSTWTKSLLKHPEDEKLLLAPGRQFDNLKTIDTEVFILGAGTS